MPLRGLAPSIHAGRSTELAQGTRIADMLVRGFQRANFGAIQPGLKFNECLDNEKTNTVGLSLEAKTPGEEVKVGGRRSAGTWELSLAAGRQTRNRGPETKPWWEIQILVVCRMVRDNM